jgi:putative component of membrane protein insertase Oxa1/YidC/SpoIIIJ protein YidD
LPGLCSMRSRLNFFLFILLVTTSAFCQIENLKWQKENISYEKADQVRKENYSFQSDNAGEFIKKSLVNAYWFFISDVDGDNCAFQPTCSSFFIDATEETNIVQGSLMFSDRLIRDSSPFKINDYPRDKSGYYYDPAHNYTLSQRRIKYLPPTFVADDE